MISKGDRVQGRRNGKTGTVTADPYKAMAGWTAAYVRWDGSTRPPAPVRVDNLIKLAS